MRKEKLLLQYSMIAVMERLKLKLLYRFFLMSPKAEHMNDFVLSNVFTPTRKTLYF